MVVASPLFIGIVLSVLGRAAAIEPSSCWCVGHTSQHLAALLLFCAAERPQLTSSVCCGVDLPRSGIIEEMNTFIVDSKCSGHRHIGEAAEFRGLDT